MKRNSNAFWTLALQSGYLTRSIDDKKKFVIPNCEVLAFYSNTILKLWLEKEISNESLSEKFDYNKMIREFTKIICNDDITIKSLINKRNIIISRSWW